MTDKYEISYYMKIEKKKDLVIKKQYYAKLKRHSFLVFFNHINLYFSVHNIPNIIILSPI